MWWLNRPAGTVALLETTASRTPGLCVWKERAAFTTSDRKKPTPRSSP
jgi:hypothetical protein